MNEVRIENMDEDMCSSMPQESCLRQEWRPNRFDWIHFVTGGLAPVRRSKYYSDSQRRSDAFSRWSTVWLLVHGGFVRRLARLLTLPVDMI